MTSYSRVVLWLVLCSLPSSQLYGWLGDTEKEAQEHYGKPIEKNTRSEGRSKSQGYHFKDFIISVEFIDGRSQNEVYASADDRGLSDAEIQILLKMNTNGKDWRNWEPRHWSFVNDPGGPFLAVYQPEKSPPLLRVTTLDYISFVLEPKQTPKKRAEPHPASKDASNPSTP